MSKFRKSLTKIISFLLILSMFLSQSAYAADLMGGSVGGTEDEFIQPETVDVTEDNEYKKDPLLKLPETTDDTQEESDGELVSVGEYTKIYKTGDNDYKTVYTSIPNTYKDTLGKQHEIDNTLEKKDSLFNGTYFTNKANDMNVTLPAQMTGSDGIEISRNGVSIKLIPMDGDYTNAAVKDNAILYNNVYDGVDVQYTVKEIAVKEDIILNKYVENNTFRFCIEADNVDLRLEDGVINVYKWDSDEPVMELVAPAMTDASGAFSPDLTLSLDKSLGSNIVTITADKDWLAAPDRAYPVKIDPTAGFINIETAAISLVTTSSSKGTNQGAPYGYAGFIRSSDAGEHADFGMTRMYLKADINFDLMPADAEIKSAKLVMFQYGNYSHGSTGFTCYALHEPLPGGNQWMTTINWGNTANIPRSPAGDTVPDPDNPSATLSASSSSRHGFHYFNVTETINDWKKELLGKNGLVIMADDESATGGAFFTPYSGLSSNGQDEFTPDKAPHIEINWHIPGDVPDRDINDVTINLRPVAESSIQGKLMVDAISFDGLAKPGSEVTYWLNDSSKGYGGTVEGGVWFAYPDSTSFESYFPNARKYRLKKSNWQTNFPFTAFDFNTLYNLTAYASYDGKDGAQNTSDSFTIYQIKQFDTLPNIANYYGVNLGSMMYDNRVQDCLLVENNTLFIRNPQKNATIPYNPAPLSDDMKRKIDAALMGRGLHCEFGFEPVNLNTGNFYLNTDDVTIPDYNGDFSISRSYNSKGASYNSMFGRGWSFTYDEKLSILSDNSILYSRSDGSGVSFTPDGNGGYTAPDGVYLTLDKMQTDSTTIDYGDDDIVTYPIYEYEIKDADKTVRRFNAYGQLTRITDSQGFTTTLNYNDSYQLSSVVSPSGKQYQFTENGNGEITQIALPNGSTLKYTYDDNDNLASFTDATGSVTTYVYDDKHQMLSWSDGNGTKITQNEYDGEGRVVKQTDGEGKISTLVYADGQTKTTDANGNITTYFYDGQYRTTKIEYPDGSTVLKGYDDNNNQAFETNQMGHTTSYEYDGNGNVTKETRYDGASKTYTYNNLNKATSVTDYDGKVTAYSYDGNGNITKVTYSDGSFTVYAYDSNNRLTSATDAKGAVTTYAYTGPWLTGETDPAGSVTSYAYNALGQLASVTDAAGNITRYMYDNAGRKTGEQNANGEYTQYVYDAGGRCTAIINPKGYRTDVEYSKTDNILKVTDPMENVYTYTYDAIGNKTSETDSAGKTTAYEYDTLSRLVKQTDSDGGVISYKYDKLGNATETTDQNGNTTKTEYDYRFNQPGKVTDASGNETVTEYNSIGLPTSQNFADNTGISLVYDALNRLKSYTDAAGLVTQYSYDAGSNLLSMSDNVGRIWYYEYDALNQCVKQVSPNGGVTTASYDRLGNLIQAADPLGNITKLSYDKAGRLTSTTDAQNGKLQYEYDLNGNLIKQIDENGAVTTGTYDPLDRVSVTTDEKNASSKVTYDAAGNIKKTTDALGNESSYTYNALGLPLTYTDAEGNKYTYKYDAAGNNTEITAPDKTKTVMNYDNKNQLTKVTYATGLEVSYTYDQLGRVVKEKDNAGTDTGYFYDARGNLVSATDALGRVTAYTYDLAGNLTGTKGYDGNETKYAYDKEGNVTSITDAENKTTHYTYDLNGNLLSSKDASLREYTYTYDKLNRLTGYTDPLGAVTSYAYDGAGNLLSITDAANGKEIYAYDEAGNPVSMTDKNGNTTSLSYDALGRVIKQTASDSGETEYLYDKLSRLSGVKDALGNITRYGYDSVGNLTEKTMPNSGTYHYSYDGAGSQVAETDPLGNTTSYSYDLLERLTGKTLANTAQYTYSYDTAGRITGTTAPNGQAVSYFYDSKGNLKEQKDGEGRTITYSYDRMHRLISTTNPLGAKTAYSYDTNGNLKSVTSPKGSTYSYQYDKLDRITQETNPAGAVTNYAYDLVGNLKTVTETGGRVTSYGYDANGNLTEAINALDQKTSYAYDSMNRLISETDAKGGVTSYGYDLLGNVTSITDALGNQTKMAYDKDSNLVGLKDAKGNETNYAYDLADRLVGVTDPTGALTSYTYDSVGNLTSKTDAKNNTTYYTYDLESNLTSTTNPLGQKESFAYDVNGNLTSYTKADGKTIDYDYDKLDQLTSRDYDTKSEGVVLYGYDKDGNAVSMDDTLGNNKYEYNAMGQITKVTSSDGNVVAYGYDIYGNLTSLTYPDGRSIRYEYNAINQLTKVTDRNGLVTQYFYDEKGNVTKTQRPNGTKSIAEYNALDQLTVMTNYDSKGKVISKFTYGYDPDGNIITETASGGDVKYDRSYTYTARGELATVTEKSGRKTTATAYTYDASGNRTKMTENAQGAAHTITYTYNSGDQLIKSTDSVWGVTNYTYDKNGNLINEQTGYKVLSYGYTDENRLKSVKQNGVLLMAALYDGNGDRLFSVNRYGMENNIVPIWEYDNPYDIVDGNIGGIIGGGCGNNNNNNNNNNGSGHHPGTGSTGSGNTGTGHLGNNGSTGTGQDHTGSYSGGTTNGGSHGGSSGKGSHNGKGGSRGNILTSFFDRMKEPSQVVFWYGFKESIFSCFSMFGFGGGFSDTLNACFDKAYKNAGGHSGRSEAKKYHSGASDNSYYNYVTGWPNYGYDPDGNYNYGYGYNYWPGWDIGTWPNYRYWPGWGYGWPDYGSYPWGTPGNSVTGTYIKDDNRRDVVEDVLIPYNVNASDYGNYELTSYVNDINCENTQVLMEYGAYGTVSDVYEYGNQRLDTLNSSGLEYYSYDGRGSVSNLTSPFGNNMVSYSYDAYGKQSTYLAAEYSGYNYPGYGEYPGYGYWPGFGMYPGWGYGYGYSGYYGYGYGYGIYPGYGYNYTYDGLNLAAAGNNHYGYNGETTDIGTGLQYLRARYYDSDTGRFTSQDSYSGILASPLTQNKYIYTGNNPLNYTDPSGHWPKFLDDAVKAVKKTVKTVVSTVTGAVYALGKSVVSLATGKGLPEPAEMLQDYKKGYQIGSQAVNNPIGTAKKIVNKAVTKAIKVAEEAKRKLCESASKIEKQIAPVVGGTIDFLMGMGAAFHENYKTPYDDVYVPQNKTTYYTGKVTGDIVSTVLGVAEMGLGAATEGIGIDLDATGIGAVIGIPLNIAGAAVIVHGGTTAVSSAMNIGQDIGNLIQSKSNEGGKSERPDYVRDNRVPQDKETVLSGKDYQKTGKKVKGAQVYKNGDQYYYRDTFHTGESAHLEVFDKTGKHLGEADPLTGIIRPGTADPTKTINVK